MEKTFEWPLRVYIEDTDAGGIVYYVNYLKFMERARTEFMRRLGFDKQFIFEAEMMFVVHSMNCEYVKPARLDDELIVSAEVVKSGKAFLQMAQNVYLVKNQAGERELLCRAEIKLACVGRSSIKPKRIPAVLLNKLQG